MTLLLIFLLGALLISFLCSILEASLMSTPLSYITMREEEGYKPAIRMKEYKQDSSKALAAILSLNTIANTIGAAGVGRQATLVFGSEWFGVVSAITTILILVFAEIIPKNLGATFHRQLMGFTADTVKILISCLYPIVICVVKLQKAITPANNDGLPVSREEVGVMADVAEESGELDELENDIIQNLINIDEISARDIMTPRVVAAIAPESMTVKSFYKNKRFLHHSRIPVFTDNDEYITGYILRMDALQLMAEDKYGSHLADIKREIECFQEDTPVSTVLNQMIEKNEQIGLVINEYGAFQGIISMEDVIETILGDEIVDEHDAVADMQALAKANWKKRKA